MADPPVFEVISIDQLAFDPENPRLPESLDPSDLSAVLAFMLVDAGLLDLMASIAKQGFFPGEPLLVSPSPDDGRLIVVEGNRRFASCLLLSDPELAPTRKKQVADVAQAVGDFDLKDLPCLRFSQRNDILDHLGYRHVTGIKEWEPLAKARFLQQRFDAEEGSDEARFKSLARSIGSRSDYVGRLLTAFRLYLRMERSGFWNIPGLDGDSIEFSLITSLLAYSAIVEYLGLKSSQDTALQDLQEERLKFLTGFVFARSEGRTSLGESRNIRALANVLSVTKAREVLESGASLSAAGKLAGDGADVLRSLIGGAQENLDLAFAEIEEASLGVEDVNSIQQVRDTAEQLSIAAVEQAAKHASS